MFVRRWRSPLDPETGRTTEIDLDDNLATREAIRRETREAVKVRLHRRAEQITRQWNRKQQPLNIEPLSWVFYNQNNRIEGPYQVQYVSKHPNGSLKCV